MDWDWRGGGGGKGVQEVQDDDNLNQSSGWSDDESGDAFDRINRQTTSLVKNALIESELSLLLPHHEENASSSSSSQEVSFPYHITAFSMTDFLGGLRVTWLLAVLQVGQSMSEVSSQYTT